MNELVRYEQQRAIDVRRKMLNTEAVAELSDIEKSIFAASTTQAIKEIEERTLVEKLSKLFRYVAIDVGYNIPQDAGEWQYLQTRLADVLRRYYGNKTLNDVKMAFELLVTGGLDAYLPKDSNGNPDNKHYQRFNADYIGKILKAYKAKQKEVFAKTFKNEPQEKVSREEIERAERERIVKNKGIFYRYKYGKLDFGFVGLIMCCRWLTNLGFISDIEITEADKTAAYQYYLQRYAAGFGNKYELSYVKKKGHDAHTLQPIARQEAIKRQVIEAFDYMIEIGYQP